MIVPHRKDAKHKNQILRLLREILKDNILANQLMFKGGTYATLRNLLDRFSLALNFDLPTKTKKDQVRNRCYKIFEKLNYKIKDESPEHLQFFLKYEVGAGQRNTLKLEINDNPSSENKYEKVRLDEVELYCNGHTPDTMFANKLVAAKARFDKNGKIAGRDFYDIHHFFNSGIAINRKVVEEITEKNYTEYLKSLIKFIKKEVDQRLLNEDLNPLLKKEKVNRILPLLKDELLIFIKDEIRRN
jgi:predicted nucleotidyltransferase component of viral defense system